MRQITAKQFKDEIWKDYAWASKLKEPVEVTEYCDMGGSRITHLSTFLHFTGKDIKGKTASFSKCPNLKCAEGTFDGFVDFSESGVETIGELHCGTNNSGYSASFRSCNALISARGNYPGAVAFAASGVHQIEDLVCGMNRVGVSASFTGCLNLKKGGGTYQGFVDLSASNIENADLIIINNVGFSGIYIGKKINLIGCIKLTHLPKNIERKHIVAHKRLLAGPALRKEEESLEISI